jgi:hypothetical protein
VGLRRICGIDSQGVASIICVSKFLWENMMNRRFRADARRVLSSAVIEVCEPRQLLASLASVANGLTSSGNGDSFSPQVSSDGRYVTFVSTAKNLTSSTINTRQIYRRDLQTNTTQLVSGTASGTASSQAVSTNFYMTPSGQFVLFATPASMSGSDTNAMPDWYRKDLSTGALTLVSANASGAAVGVIEGSNGSLSNNGRYAVWVDAQANRYTSSVTDSNNRNDLLYRDLTGSTTRVVSTSATNAGQTATGSADTDSTPRVTDNGQFVVFLHTGGTLTSSGDLNGVNAFDVYKRDMNSSAIAFVSGPNSTTGGNSDSSDFAISTDARYVAFDSGSTNLGFTDSNLANDVYLRDTVNNTTLLASRTTANTASNSDSGLSAVSSDGRFVVFSSFSTNFGFSDSNNAADILRYDRSTGNVALVSISTTGAAGNRLSEGGTISSDGRYVAFTSRATNLTSGTTLSGSSSQVFVRDMVAGTTSLRSASNGSTTQGSNGEASDAAVASGGSRVVFASVASNLVSGDSNSTTDIFFNTVVPPVTTPPSAPSALAVTGTTNAAVSLRWTDNSSNETTFKIERGTSNTGPFTQVGTTAANATTFTVGGLLAGTTYFFRVRAANGAGDSGYTSVVSATTASAPPFAVLSAGVLTVTGTAANDVIGLSLNGTNLVAKLGARVQTFANSSVTSIRVLAGGGSDVVTLGPGVRGSRIEGDSGNDTLVGGTNSDTILGGTGNDVIVGGLGTDSLDGGDGDDFFMTRDNTIDAINGGIGTDLIQQDGTDIASLVELVLD